MIIKNEINDPIIREAIKRVMAILETERLYQEINNTHFFGLEDFVPEVCSNRFSLAVNSYVYTLHHQLEITVKPWTPFNRFTKAIAYTDYENNTVYINTRKSFGVHDRVNTIAHEGVFHGLGFGHEGNYATKFNMSSVPYLGGLIFERLSREIYGN